MMENILCALITLFTVTGMVSVIYFIMIRFVRPAKDERYYEVLVFDENEKNAALRVSFLLSQLISTGNIRNCRIIAVDCGMSEYQRNSVLGSFGNDKNVLLCSKEEAEKIIFGVST